MTAHAVLTDQERTDAIAFWREYFLSGGEGRQPSAFQLDAVNDETLRDAFMFWQIGGDPASYNAEWTGRTDALAAMVEFGESPDPRACIDAQRRVFGVLQDKGVEVSDLDTGTVFTLMYVMWLLLGGAYTTAASVVSKISTLTLRASTKLPDQQITHSDPLTGLGMAAATMLIYSNAGMAEEDLLKVSAEMFGLSEEAKQTRFARKAVADIESMHKEVANAEE